MDEPISCPTVRRAGADHRAVPAGQHRRPGEHLKAGCVNNHWLTPLAEMVDGAPLAVPAEVQAPVPA